MIVVYLLLSITAAAVLFTAVEVLILISKKTAQELPSQDEAILFSTSINEKTFEDLYCFLCDDESAPFFSEEETTKLIEKQCNYMKMRFDCADFRAQLLFKVYKDCSDRLSDNCKRMIKDAFLGFKYFMDEPGDDSMCYWSENHQILFAVAEYLAGQEWPDDIFTNNGMTGKMHLEKAKERIYAWTEQRFYYGFSEYLSNNYLAEDIAPMGNFIAYCKDKEFVNRMKTVMDILWLDVALNSVNNRFVAVSSRMYGNNKMCNIYGNSIQTAMNILWGYELKDRILNNSNISENEKELFQYSLCKKPNYITICFTDIVRKGLYVLPDAIKEIALSEERIISKTGCGISPDDMKKDGLIGQSVNQIMAQLGAEAFTNPEVIKNTLTYLKNNNMFGNSFVTYFRFLTISVFKAVDFEKLTKRFSMLPHGIATGRGNIYTYKTLYYSMSTDICKDTGSCGAQDHQWTACISEDLSLFTTHPAGNGNNRFNSSPGYWIGNGRRPMSVQHKSVNITIYRIPDKKVFGETAISEITHAYMPKDFYDEFELCGNYVFARKNAVFVAMISNGNLSFKPFDEESAKGIQKGYNYLDSCNLKSEFDLFRLGGRYHVYITELSDITAETFYEFKERIKRNPIHFNDGSKVSYVTECGEISACYNEGYSVNGITQDIVFDRYDSIFCKCERKAESITVKSKNASLYLNLQKNQRKTG